MNIFFKTASICLALNVIVLLAGCREEPIAIEQYGSVSGQVLDSNTLLPVAGASVSTNPTHSSTNTDSLGSFKFEGLPVGNFSLKTEKAGYVTEFEAITILEDQEINVKINLSEEIVENQAPGSPSLLSPLDNSTDVLTDVQLSWNRGDNYLEDDLTFDVFLINEHDEEIELAKDYQDTSFLLENLNYNTTYFWYVIAKDGVHADAPSKVSTFKTIDISNNLFLFTRQVNGFYAVMSGDFDSLNVANLTNNNTNNWNPQYSPDGSLIAYISVVDNANHIFVMEPNGNNSRKITSIVPINYYDPLDMNYCWSPDGSKILYMNFDKLYLQDINTTGGPANAVLNSPDGNAFASCDWRGNSILARTTNSEGFESTFYLFNAQTFQLVDTIAYFERGRTGGPRFSEGGDKIVFTHDVHFSPSTLQQGLQRDSEIFLIDKVVPPYNAVSLSDFYKPVGTNDISARFSPSGAFIIYTNQNIDGLETPAIYRLDITDLNDRIKIFQNAMMPDWRNL